MKKISTKINIAILSVLAAILAFVGVALIINMTLDYHRAFESTCDLLFESDDFKAACGDRQKLSKYLLSQKPLLNRDSQKQYYVLENGNIVESSAVGGVLNMTSNLKAVLGGQKSVAPALNAKLLDFAVDAKNGFVVYIIDDKAELYESIFDISLLFLQALLLAFALAAVISYFVSKKLTASVKTLADGAASIAAGEFKKIEVDSRDEIGKLCDIFNDMSEQIQKDYDEFEKIELSRREFVANVSHELKTPLTVIKSYSQTLSAMEVDADTRREFLSVIESESDRMTEIVGQLLQLSRLETPVSTLYSELDLHALCKSITDALLIEAKKKGIEFEINGRQTVVTDADKVKTILTNLLSNAVKYSDSDSKVIIDVTEKSVAVTNFGIGIGKDDLEHIFERFYRTDKARGRTTGGTGLGLAIAKASAQAIGADITAKSEGGKTVFTLEFGTNG